MDLKLSGRRALVSGATRGIGRAIAEALAAEGASVFLVARGSARLRVTAQELTAKYGVQCGWAAVDYMSPGAGQHAVDRTIAMFEGIDILVNNAGQSLPGNLATPNSEWLASYQLNFLSHLEAIRAAAPFMQAQRWGRIVNITGAHFRQPRRISTGTPAKYALLSTSKALARQFAPNGITINSVNVGHIESHQINEVYYPTVESRQELAQRDVPLGRLGLPEEVAAAVAFLASPLASYVVGSSITVDGGMTLSIV